MAVRITDIKVESLGPLQSFAMSLGALNLIYGRNECGKTYLVEFIIRSLFKNTTAWDPRDITAARGDVQVAGLGDKPVSFSPANKKRKLEDYLLETIPGVPLSLPRLLVVKGADLKIVRDDTRGVNRTALRDYLSGAETLEGIEKSIKVNVRKATIANGNIVGPRAGEVKDRELAMDRIKIVDDLLARIDTDFSGGQAGLLNARLQAVRARRDAQIRAKCHYAYSLHEEIRQLESQRDALPKADLQNLAANVQDCDRKTAALAEKERDWQAKRDRTQHYPWLKHAIETYQNATRAGQLRANPVLAIVALILVVSAIVLPFFGLAISVPVISAVLLLPAVVCAYLYFRQMRMLVVQARDALDAESVGKEFTARFARPFGGLAVLREQEEQLSGDYHQADLLQKQIETERQELTQLRLAITECFQRLVHEHVKREAWQSKIKELMASRENLEREIAHRQVDLAKLGVDESDYRSEAAELAYNPAERERASAEEQILIEQMQDESHTLNGLRQEICKLTSDHIDTLWEKLIEHLRQRRAEAVQDYKVSTAGILAGNIVGKVLDEMRSDEDQRIKSGLQSDIVTAPLQAITGRYRRIEFENDDLKVANDYEEFSLAELSTGAQEQVLLALRIGFAARNTGQDRLFLILDDAFQHSDWQRRECLVDATVGLAKDGWQIIYFTMDDHVRDLFRARAGAALGNDFCYQELPHERNWGVSAAMLPA